MQQYLRTQRLQRLQDHLKSGGKGSHHNPNKSNLIPQNCLQNLFSSSALDKTFNCNDLAEKLEENLSTRKHCQGEKTLIPFDLVLKLKWQNQNALPHAIGFALPFRALPVSARESALM